MDSDRPGETGFRDSLGSAQVLRLGINSSPGTEPRYTLEVLRYSMVDSDRLRSSPNPG